jgi:hypothetical protein
MELHGFTRHEYTTPGSDPTRVVVWTFRDPVEGSIEIMEFQNIIMAKLYGKMSKGLALQITSAALHNALCELATQLDLRKEEQRMIAEYEAESSLLEPDGER